MTHATTPLVEITAKVAATGLVLASAGFGAAYAFKIGIQHGIVLAGLTVLFAIALEAAKPLAIHAAFQAFASWSVVRGLLLSLLGAVCVAYSLTSELALMSAQRSDMTAARASEAFQATAATDRYQRAQTELASLKPSRPVGELAPLVEAARPVCKIVLGTTSRDTVCSKPANLTAELGRAKRRQELEAILAEAGFKPTTIKTADPGSAALSTYLGAMGVMVSPELIGQWLNLVPVLALELGSSLAMVLVASFKGTPVVQVIHPLEPVEPRVIQPLRLQDRIVSHVVNHDGSRLSERGLAKALGADRNAVRRTIQTLVAGGILASEASKAGTSLRFVN